MMNDELWQGNTPLWDQLEDGEWDALHIGARFTDKSGRSGIITRIEPAAGHPEQLLDWPPEFRAWGNVYVRWD